MFVHKLGILLFMFICVKAEIWTLPTAADVQTSLETCHLSNLIFLNDLSEKYTNIRCLGKELGLWNDDEGFRTKRFVKFLNKYQQPLEISIVIDYCNRAHKQTDPDKWANEAFYCFARGRLGRWINELIKNIYKKKTNE